MVNQFKKNVNLLKTYKIKRKFTFFSKYQIYFISGVENIEIFIRAAHSWKFWCFQHTRWNIFGIHLKKVNILYILLSSLCFLKLVNNPYNRLYTIMLFSICVLRKHSFLLFKNVHIYQMQYMWLFVRIIGFRDFALNDLLIIIVNLCK